MADQDRGRWTKLVADRARWTKLVAGFEARHPTRREFATERGVSFTNLRYWTCRLRKGT